MPTNLRNTQADSTGDILLSGLRGIGIKQGASKGWTDLTGQISPKTSGIGSPTRRLYRGTYLYAYAFASGDVLDLPGFHIPHDYVPGTDMYIHVHWSHNGTTITGTAEFTFYLTSAQGHGLGTFHDEISPVVSFNTVNVATTPQYVHRVDEVLLSTPGGSATELDTDDLDIDGLIWGAFRLTQLPTIGGGYLYIHAINIHYQSTGILTTPNKSPPFSY